MITLGRSLRTQRAKLNNQEATSSNTISGASPDERLQQASQSAPPIPESRQDRRVVVVVVVCSCPISVAGHEGGEHPRGHGRRLGAAAPIISQYAAAPIAVSTIREEDRVSSFVSLMHRRPPSSPSRECVLFCSTAAWQVLLLAPAFDEAVQLSARDYEDHEYHEEGEHWWWGGRRTMHKGRVTTELSLLCVVLTGTHYLPLTKLKSFLSNFNDVYLHKYKELLCPIKKS